MDGVRLAFRVEGRFINAYIADSGTMKGAIHIGSLSLAVAKNSQDIWQHFKGLMTLVLTEALRDAGLQAGDMIERPGPEHERSGSA